MIVWATMTGYLVQWKWTQERVEEFVITNPTSFGDFMMLSAPADSPERLQTFIGSEQLSA